MARHLVICQECARRFDANKGGYYNRQSRRYLCKSCGKKMKKAETEIRKAVRALEKDENEALRQEQATIKREQADERARRTGMRQTKGAMIAKLIIGGVVLISPLAAEEVTPEGVIGCILIGAGLIFWALFPYFRGKKRLEAAAVEEQTRMEHEAAQQKICPSCGAITRGSVCEYCGNPLQIQPAVASQSLPHRPDIEDIDGMDGHQFEYFCADLLRRCGFENVTVTPASNDQGVDVLAEKDGIKYAIQCKNYSSPLGNTPVQEVYAGKQIYGCQIGAVLTNSTFTSGARAAAESTGILLWDRDKLAELIETAARQ